MNKNKKDEHNNSFNHKLILHSILVYDGQYLLAKTFQERQEMLNDLIKVTSYNEYIDQVSDNIFMSKTYYSDFENIWKELIKVDMLEGLVLKKMSAKLETGYRQTNNTAAQIKCRKPTKNYRY